MKQLKYHQNWTKMVSCHDYWQVVWHWCKRSSIFSLVFWPYSILIIKISRSQSWRRYRFYCPCSLTTQPVLYLSKYRHLIII